MLHGIIRKLRLADLQRSCRLPIGAWPLQGWRRFGRFPFRAAKCLVSVEPVDDGVAGVATPAMADLLAILGRKPDADRLLRSPARVASDPPAWTCVL